MKRCAKIFSLIAAALLMIMPLALFGCTEKIADDGPEKNIFSVSEVSCSNGENNIYGKLYVPNEVEGKMPAVILSHSANMTCDSMNLYAAAFAKRGFIAYTFDFCGGSSNSRSDGNCEDMTIFTEIADLKAAIATVSAMDNVDNENIYLFGTSQGGLVTALTAEECATEIKGEILLYPAFNIPELVEMASNWGSMGSLGGYGQAFMDTMSGYDVYSNIGNFSGDVLIIHGSSDFIVNKSYSQKAATLYANCTLKIIDGAGHGFNSENYSLGGDYDDEVWEYIDTYLNKT